MSRGNGCNLQNCQPCQAPSGIPSHIPLARAHTCSRLCPILGYTSPRDPWRSRITLSRHYIWTLSPARTLLPHRNTLQGELPSRLQEDAVHKVPLVHVDLRAAEHQSMVGSGASAPIRRQLFLLQTVRALVPLAQGVFSSKPVRSEAMHLRHAPRSS